MDNITLRQYYIAHAPEHPQPWFKPALLTARPKDVYRDEQGNEYPTSYDATKAVGDDGWSNAAHKDQEAWDKVSEKARYTQWPAAWADEMVKHHSGEPSRYPDRRFGGE